MREERNLLKMIKKRKISLTVYLLRAIIGDAGWSRPWENIHLIPG